jgi:hypothetical protein
VRAALINMGIVLTANSNVETDPARTATLAMSATLRRTCRDARRVSYPSLERVMGEFPYVRCEAGQVGELASTSPQLLVRCSRCSCCRVQVSDVEFNVASPVQGKFPWVSVSV